MPTPSPLAPEVMLIKLELVEADHGQPDGILTVKLPVPPVIGKPCPVGVMVNAQAEAEVVKLT